jgi:hypothetical protein
MMLPDFFATPSPEKNYISRSKAFCPPSVKALPEEAQLDAHHLNSVPLYRDQRAPPPPSGEATSLSRNLRDGVLSNKALFGPENDSVPNSPSCGEPTYNIPFSLSCKSSIRLPFLQCPAAALQSAMGFGFPRVSVHSLCPIKDTFTGFLNHSSSFLFLFLHAPSQLLTLFGCSSFCTLHISNPVWPSLVLQSVPLLQNPLPRCTQKCSIPSFC